ncbi:OmpA family protein [Hydrocarboniphaga sp.]|uniref:OmpA family protein n=1 Tax=Hydrocarboniphaga sp. TaxID=2033016 RepID=UPI003D0B290D
MKKTAWALALMALPMTMTSAWAQMESTSEPMPVPAADPVASMDAAPVAESAAAAEPAAAPVDAGAAPAAAPVAEAMPAPEAPPPAPTPDPETYPDMTKPGTAIAKRFYIAPMFDYTFADSDRQSDDGLGGRFIIGKQIAQGFHLEISGLYEQYKAKSGSGKEKLTGGGITALVFPSERFTGFFGSAGVSYAKGKSDVVTTPNSDQDSTVWDVGLGYLVGPFRWLNDGSLRLEARYQADEKHVRGAGNDFLEPVLSAGLLIPLGSAPTPPPPVVEPVAVVPVVAPADSDGDGVTDDKDQCPGTPQGTVVNAVGCPLPPPCKPPEAGQRVDLSGCAAGDTIVLRGVNFDFDKASLTVNAKTILDGVADGLTAAPDVQVEVGGHTDSKGSDAYNQKLSERRAESVMEYLVGRGIDPGRITSAGYGETQPVADNETDEGRELNRRVELKITAGASQATVAPMAPSEATAIPAPGSDPYAVPPGMESSMPAHTP